MVALEPVCGAMTHNLLFERHEASHTFEEPEQKPEAADPVEFLPPVISPAKRETVTAWNPITCTKQVCLGVIHGKEISNNPRAYWPQKRMRDAIYGSVWFCVVLVQKSTTHSEIDRCWEITNEPVAIKMISQARTRKLKDRLFEDPLKEIAALQYMAQATEQNNNCEETHVISSIEVLQDAIFIYSVLPFYHNGDLYDLVSKYAAEPVQAHGMPEAVARHCFRQILLGLSHLQSVGMCHRDISLENIMVDGENCWIIDLGLCLRIPQNGSTCRLIKPQGACGKWKYMSPEVRANEDAIDGFAVDLWSAGVILYVMLTGFAPYSLASRTDPQYELIVNGMLVEQLKKWQVDLSLEAGDLLQNMFQEDPRDRLSLAQVMSHPWVSQGEAKAPFTSNTTLVAALFTTTPVCSTLDLAKSER